MGEEFHTEGPVAGGVADIDAVSRVDGRHHGVTHRAPCVFIGELVEHRHVDRHAAVLHQGGRGCKLAVVHGNAEVDLRQHSRQEAPQIVHVAGAVGQNLLLLFRRERPSAHDAIAHRVLLLLVGVAESVVAQRAEQSLAFRRPAAVGQIPECGTQVENVCRQWPAEREVAGAFGVGGEADEQHAAIDSVRRTLAKPIAPEPERPPGAQLVRHQADDIGVLPWPRDKLKIVQPDFFKRQLTRSHGTPTS